MKKYIKAEIEIISLEEVDVIATSETDIHETLITKGGMIQNIDSENVGLFR